MDSIIVQGNGPVSGEIPISGAKNAALTLMPATLLTDEPEFLQTFLDYLILRLQTSYLFHWGLRSPWKKMAKKLH